ncbi:MAG: NAD(P)/FAD-dependent oxidoreductase [Acidimicrobiales bacterium]
MSADPRIVIIGAGIAGIGTAIKLREAGFDNFEIVEKSHAFGGTWLDNSYPGASCDVPAHLYTLSFEPNPDWRETFAGQPEILAHIQATAAKHGLDDVARFGTEIAAAEWDHDHTEWVLTTTDGDEIRATIVISGLGQLNRPSVPPLPGLDTFAGTTFHSARWNHDHDLAGRRVAVIGTGASAVQFVPEIVPSVAHLDLYQRSANWVMPRRNPPISAAARRRFRRIPGWRRLHRLGIYLRFEILVNQVFNTGSFANRKATEEAVKYLESAVPDDELRERLTPEYPIGCTRILGHDGWYSSLQEPQVDVVTTGIREIVADGVITDDGEHRPADTIIFGTGFDTNNFLAPVDFIGRDGISIRRRWAQGAEAYLGITVADFPNLFMLYGPNTNLGHNSIIFMIEQQIHHTVGLLERMRDEGIAAIDLHRHEQDRFNRRIQERMKKRVWVTSCSSWYKNDSGKVVNNWPGSTIDYRRKCRQVSLDRYEQITAAGDV